MQQIIHQIKGLIDYRHLIWDLAIKDIKVRYRSPALGFLWAIIIPLITVFIFKLVFSTIMKAQVENYPFFIYLMTALIPWSYFTTSINGAVESILNSRDLIKKTYFPRQVIPVSTVLASLINFFPALIVMLLILGFFRMQFTILLLFLPVILLLQTILSVGLALIVSSLQVVFRDVKYTVEILLTALLFFSPGFYSLTLVADVSQKLLKAYALNPFVGLFSLYRIALLKGFADTLPAGLNIYLLSAWAVIVCVAVFLLGFLIFRKYEPQFSDLI